MKSLSHLAFSRRAFLATTAAGIASQPWQVRAQEKAAALDLGTRLELFVDELLIAKLTGDAKSHLHQPEPKDVALITDEPWEGNTCAYYTLFQDGPRYRMYYRGSHWDETAKRATHPEVTCYAESKDGIRWDKPTLGLFEFGGSKKNNIVWMGNGTHCFAPFKDENPACAPAARYKAISSGYPGGKKGLYAYHSADGLRWQLQREEPVITEGAFDSQNLAFWDEHAQMYREYHRTFVNGVRAIMTGTSADFLKWTPPQLLTYQLGVPDEHLYTNTVRPYPRAPHLLIGFPARFLPKSGQRVEPVLMASRDGRRFHRWATPVIPETAPKDRGGNRSNYMTWGLVTLPDRPNHLSVYATEAYYTGPSSRVRRFEYRVDGFVSIRAGAAGGELITPPIKLGPLAERLEINYATREEGHLRVALETPEGQPLPGRALDNCPPLRGDRVRHTVSWKQDGDISTLKGRIVRLRFEMKNADLYSLRLQPWLT